MGCWWVMDYKTSVGGCAGGIYQARGVRGSDRSGGCVYGCSSGLAGEPAITPLAYDELFQGLPVSGKVYYCNTMASYSLPR